jgi:hypothetical protein
MYPASQLASPRWLVDTVCTFRWAVERAAQAWTQTVSSLYCRVVQPQRAAGNGGYPAARRLQFSPMR